MKGKFITFEGPDGSGKTTQIKKVYQYLLEKDIPVLMTREPGGTRVSDEIRSILLNPEYNEITHETEVLLYAASRAQHVREKVTPALLEGQIVLCDRFVDASIAYQGYGLSLPLDQLISINQWATGGVEPVRSYFIDISPEKARDRLLSRGNQNEGLDRIELKGLDYHARVREGFNHIYEENKDRVLKINGDQTIDSIFQEIMEDLDEVLKDFLQ